MGTQPSRIIVVLVVEIEKNGLFNTKTMRFAEPFQVARLSSKDHDWLFSALYLIRVFVAMVLKVSLLEIPVW
jgi:hypothetical protein